MISIRAAILFILLNIILFTSAVSSKNLECPPPHSPSGNPAPKMSVKCPRDTLKFGVCGDWLGLVHETIGSKPSPQCCALLTGVANIEAALCICTAIKANVLNVVKLDIPVALSLVVNSCGKRVPDGFVCP